MMDEEELSKEIRWWFYNYASAFSELASCNRADTAVLLDYYTAPMRIVGLTADMVMRSPEAIRGYGGVGAEIERLRRSGLVEAKITDLSVNLINGRCVILEAAWWRTFVTGEAYGLREVYIVVGELIGWRITTVIQKPH